MRTWMLFVLVVGSLYAESVNFGIIGGSNSSGLGYAALLGPHSTTAPQTILLPPNTFSVRTVAINNAGFCLVGCGTFSGNSYAARLLPNSISPQALNIPTTTPVRDVAINNLRVCFISCGNVGNGYAARILPDSITPQVINLPSGKNGIRRIGLNDAGAAIIGGCAQDIHGLPQPNTGYSAYIPPGSADPQPIDGEISILYVAINDSGAGIIGGGNDSTQGYAAFVMPNSTAVQEISLNNAPLIYAVALNNSGNGLIGGNDTINGYAALVAFNNPNPIQIAVPPHTPIFGVDINNAGVGLIGGGLTNGYAALVTPEGSITPLALPVTNCPILSVALNDQGVGLIGGEDSKSQNTYVALVAPNGTLTPLTIPEGEGVGFVDINDQFVSSVGPYSSAVNTQLAASYALETRFMVQKSEPHFTGEIGYLADADDNIGRIYQKNQSKHSVWTTPFGDYVHSKNQRKIPSFTNEIAGILAGLDYHVPDLMLGGALGYVFNYIHYAESLGHGHLQEEIACFYSSFKKNIAWIQAVLWGGYYQVYNERHMLSVITSTAHFSGWILAPQMEIALPFAFTHNQLNWIEPFVVMDWVNSWQGHFTEKGTSGFNLVMKSLNSSLLQSELGLRFYEHFEIHYGRFSLIEKLSYVNQAPFHIKKASTYFLIPTSSFPVVTGSSRVQNLGGIQLCGQFSPSRSSYPYISLSFQGLLGSSYQSYFMNLTVGKDF